MPKKKRVLKRPPMPGAGRPKTGQAKDWVTINVEKKVKREIEKRKKENQSINDYIAELLSKKFEA